MQNKNVNLTENESEVLREVFDCYLSELSSEISDTDSKDFRDILKTKRILMHKILRKLETDDELESQQVS